MRWRCLFFGLVGLATACSPSVDLSAIPEQENAPPIYRAGPDLKIKIVGSSTVAPFSTTVAEHFGAASGFVTPIVESTGTGGGIKSFCEAIGPDEPSIVNASRKIKPSEQKLCAENGITNLIEVKIGYDGIVLANVRGGPDLDMTKAQIFEALAARLPDGNGGWVKNPHRNWSDISPELPDMRILVSGPPPTSGTRDAFVEVVMGQGALAFPEYAALSETDVADFRKRAFEIRNDGAWIDSGENDSSIINTLLQNPDAIGVLGYSFLEQNLDRVKGARIGGVEPVFEEIANGNYGVSRSMYFYIKRENIPLVPGLVAFVDEFTQDYAWGDRGYLVDKGLIPLQAEARSAIREETLASLN